eukprot:8519448-Prorocentrum_lima.AAC.1
MTSSLVGSEMCIRDRKLHGSVLCSEGLAAKVIGRTVKGVNLQFFPPSPVSYTHLTLPTICSV